MHIDPHNAWQCSWQRLYVMGIAKNTAAGHKHLIIMILGRGPPGIYIGLGAFDKKLCAPKETHGMKKKLIATLTAPLQRAVSYIQ